ncbi:hypothetical protein KJ359_012392 [Pestalotiopsis sp. 9143b]|nr:hypothetical protein KJ359_012392 [Pestalotiopsis sp. 9143b]
MSESIVVSSAEASTTESSAVSTDSAVSITSSTILATTSSTGPAPTQTLILRAARVAAAPPRGKRQLDIIGGFINIYGVPSADCNAAAPLILQGGQLFAMDGLPFGIDPSASGYSPFSASQARSISTSFSISDAGVVQWQNAYFPSGVASFCQITSVDGLTSEGIVAYWNGIPANCVQVSITAYRQEQCQSDGTISSGAPMSTVTFTSTNAAMSAEPS